LDVRSEGERLGKAVQGSGWLRGSLRVETLAPGAQARLPIALKKVT